MENNNILNVTPAPHIKSSYTVSSTMLDVIIALIPAFIASLFFFGIKALILVVTCVFFCVMSEHFSNKIMNRKNTINDYSAVVTGVLLAFCLPPATPWYIAAIGAVFAMVFGKMVFGGLGFNIFNPALVGRAFLLASWPVYMTTWGGPEAFVGDKWFSLTEFTTSATPLGAVKDAVLQVKDGADPGVFAQVYDKFPLSEMFLGNISGSLGETSSIALLLGAFYLWFYKKHITWHIPVTFIGTTLILAYIFGGPEPFTGNVLYHLTGGGLILGAFFMATDMVTTPITPRGRMIFGIGCGILVAVIRIFGGYPEGVCYAILIMNSATPLIDNLTKPRIYGEVK
ncbi:MAG: RnfABCDGE type electron transport complex subunit D [Candidatus Muiribacteriota bacterium]